MAEIIIGKVNAAVEVAHKRTESPYIGRTFVGKLIRQMTRRRENTGVSAVGRERAIAINTMNVVADRQHLRSGSTIG